MQESIQIKFVVIAGSILFVSLVIFIIFSVIMYQNSRRKHEENLQLLKNKFKNEILQVNVEVKQSTLNKISEEIHDNVGQILSLVKLNLHQLKKEAVPQRIDDTLELTNSAIQGLRNVAHIISSNTNNENDIIELCQKEIEQLNNTNAIEAKIEVSETFEQQLSSDVTLILYRIIQESINNAIKHSNANMLKIIINEVSNDLIITIKDNGIGFDIEKQNSSNGIQNLKRRAQLINAQLLIQSTINKGTKIQIIIANKNIT